MLLKHNFYTLRFLKKEFRFFFYIKYGFYNIELFNKLFNTILIIVSYVGGFLKYSDILNKIIVKYKTSVDIVYFQYRVFRQICYFSCVF